MEVVTDAGNETVSVSWIAPRTPNGDSVFYKVWLNDAPKPVIVHQTSVNIRNDDISRHTFPVVNQLLMDVGQPLRRKLHRLQLDGAGLQHCRPVFQQLAGIDLPNKDRW